MILFPLAVFGMFLIPIAPWLGGGILALCSYASAWMWSGTSEWLETAFFFAGILSVLAAFCGVA